MHKRKKEMLEFIKVFDDMPDRLLKYMEILLLGKDASPYCYQDTMSYRRLAIAVSTYCNLNCKWCYRHDSKFKSILNKHMEINVLREIIDNTNGYFRLIHLAGLGEPLLYPHLIEAVKIVRKKTNNVKITTNSTLLSRDKVDKLIEAGLTHIEVSIDAFSSEDLFSIRGSKLEELVENVKYISNNTELFLQVNSVVSSLNYKALFNAVDVLKDAKNIKILHTIPLFITEQLRGTDITRISDEKYIRLLKKIENDIKMNRLNWKLFPSSHGVSIDPIIEMKRRRNICFTCFEDPYINTDGFLCACGRREFHPIVDAKKGFERAMNSPEILKYREDMLKGNYPDYCSELCYLKKKNNMEK